MHLEIGMNEKLTCDMRNNRIHFEIGTNSFGYRHIQNTALNTGFMKNQRNRNEMRDCINLNYEGCNLGGPPSDHTVLMP